jgi:hypothetical protein
MISSCQAALSLIFSYSSSLADVSGGDVAHERAHRNRVEDEDQRKPKNATSERGSGGGSEFIDRCTEDVPRSEGESTPRPPCLVRRSLLCGLVPSGDRFGSQLPDGCLGRTPSMGQAKRRGDVVGQLGRGRQSSRSQQSSGITSGL